MNVDALLNLEAEEVQRAIQGLMDGTVNPEEVQIEGIETEEERKRKEVEKEEKRKQYLAKEEALRQQRKAQEKERWWTGAEAFFPKQQSSTPSTTSTTTTSREEEQSQLSRYTADYSKWESWQPTDEVSRLEEEEKRRQEEEEANKLFEQNNPDFCQQYLHDMEERKKVTAKKQESADILRLKGNRFFKAKDYPRALELYMDAMKETPFDGRLLLNIAQVHIKFKAYEDALEFLSRTLYLDGKNVKALSRQAFVFSEQGQIEQALLSLKQALALDPTNADLLAQRRELDGLQRECLAEQALQERDNTKHSELFSSFDALRPLLVSFNHDDNVDDVSTHSAISSIVETLLKGLEGLADSDMDMIATYSRQSGLLEILLQDVKKLLSSADSSSIYSQQSTVLLANLIELSARLVNGQHSAKLLLLQSKIFSQELKKILNNAVNVNTSLISAIFNLIIALVNDDHSCAKARAMVCNDSLLWEIVANYLGNSSHNLLKRLNAANAAGSSSSSSLLKEEEEQQQLLDVLRKGLELIAFGTNDPQAQEVFQASSSLSIALVCSIGSVLHVIVTVSQSLFGTAGREKAERDVEQCMTILLRLSQKEGMRPAFAFPLPLNLERKVTTIGSLLTLIKWLPHQTVNVIAILMNASVLPKGSQGEGLAVIQEIYQQDGLTLSLPAIDSITVLKDITIFDLQELVRKVGLLARLVILSEVQEKLLSEQCYRSLCRSISVMAAYIAPSDEYNKWKQEGVSTYIRILATLRVIDPSVMAIGRTEGLLASIMSVFPQPRMECNEITPTSVILLPKEAFVPVLLGNAARCLIPYMDDVPSTKLLFGQKQFLAVEKLVCAMASCTDIRVRKNIAIVLAKACKTAPEVRERVSYFRGLQMMIELQNQL
eukprot:scaffold428_cov168-Ochromonas_danica.AAC.18